MKTTIAILLAIGAFLTGIGGLDLSGVIDLLPPQVARVLATALPLSAALAHVINAVVIQLRKSSEQAREQAQPTRFQFSPIALLAALLSSLAAIVLSSCAGWSVSVRSPYGDVNSDKSGSVVITPKPVVIPTK